MGSSPAIRIRNLSKAYTIAHDRESPSTLAEAITKRLRNPLQRSEKETFWALKDIDLDIEPGDVVGVIGRNGAGKSTLLKVLSRITEPTTGQIELYGRVGSLLEVGTGFHPELTGRENIYLNGAILGMRRSEIRRRFDEIVDFAGVEQFLDTPVKRYSSGMYVRLAFAVAAHLNPEILIVDEVLAVGDAEFQQKCLGKMQDVAKGGRTVLFVSHNMSAISSLCKTVLLMRSGRIGDVGLTDKILRAYSAPESQPEFIPEHGPVKRVTVSSTPQSTEFVLEYSMNHAIGKPNFGFAVCDTFGAPIFGSNQVMSDTGHLPSGSRSGVISVTVEQPKLIDGDYFLTVWFGDGGEDFCHYPQCVQFSVDGQAGSSQKPAFVKGCVWPSLAWETNIRE